MPQAATDQRVEWSPTCAAAGCIAVVAALSSDGHRRNAAVRPKVRPDGAETARLAALVDEGRLTVEVAEVFGLDRVGEAFALSQVGHVRGKLVIVP